MFLPLKEKNLFFDFDIFALAARDEFIFIGGFMCDNVVDMGINIISPFRFVFYEKIKNIHFYIPLDVYLYFLIRALDISIFL